MTITTAKAPHVDVERLEKLVTRWWELAEIGYPPEQKNRVSWAEHLERLAVEDECGKKERNG